VVLLMAEVSSQVDKLVREVGGRVGELARGERASWRIGEFEPVSR